MAKLFWVAVLGVLGAYGISYWSLSESGVKGFLNNIETLTNKGEAQALCDMLTDDMQVSIVDHTTGTDQTIKGGKSEWCQQLTATIPAMAMLQVTSEVHREEFKVQRSLLKPWIAEVSYIEKRHTSMQRAGVQMNSESEDKLVLVRTITGVKIQRLESEAWIAD